MPPIDSGWTAAIASFVSALIVAITAIAAFRQLRHYRNANDIVVYLRLIEQMDSPEMTAARASLGALAEKVASDTAYREEALHRQRRDGTRVQQTRTRLARPRRAPHHASGRLYMDELANEG